MAWKVFEKLKEKLAGAPAETATTTAAAPAAAAELQGEAPGAPDLKELEKKGLLGQFFRHWKNPAFVRQIQAVAGRMKAEGVDVKDAKAVQAWIMAHQKELEGGAATPAPAKPQTFVKSGPELGRNDPCHCGSGKKFKKCHGSGAS